MPTTCTQTGDLIFGGYSLLSRPLFEEGFQQIDQTTDLSDNWTEVSGTFTTLGMYSMQCLEAGEILYSGTPINQLQPLRLVTVPTSITSDIAIGLVVNTPLRTKLEIRTRRQDANNYIGAYIDYENSQLAIRKVEAGVATELVGKSYDWHCAYTSSHMIFLCTYGSHIFVVVDGHVAAEADSSSFSSEFGFSYSVDQLDDETIAELYSSVVLQVFQNCDPQLEDSSDLYVLFRKMIKQQIENPSEYNFDTYNKAKKLYDKYRNLGYMDEEWNSKGYPIEYPSTEKWFGGE